jgi:hypothetical protein
MAHEIIKELGDIVYCLEEEGSWHKKHIVPDNNIITADLNDWKPQVNIPYLLQPDGRYEPIENTKIITRLLNGTRIPLGVGTDRYEPIANSEVLNALTNALDHEGLPYTIRTMGTLKGSKLFFASITVDNEEERLINGDTFRMYINIIGSHDGSVSVTMYDSNMRIVCHNTFRGSQRSGMAGDVKVKVRHTRNASLALEGASQAIASIYSGRDVFVSMLKKIASIECDREQAEKIISAWQSVKLSVHDLMSTRAFNTVHQIADKFQTGVGNKGETLYDLFNGVTEYYTSGLGVGGESVDVFKKVVSSEFGSASDKKASFLDYLIRILDDNSLEEEIRKGELILNYKYEDIKEKELAK